MKNSKLIFILALMLMIISVGGVSAADDGDIAVSDVADSLYDSLNIQTVAVSDQSSESEIVTSGDGDNTTPQTYIITDDNYADYFVVDDDSDYGDRAGTIKDDAPIKDGDTLKLVSLEGKVFNINKQLTITSNSTGDVLNNCMIKLFAGADNSIISDLTIIVDTNDTTFIGVIIYLYGLFLQLMLLI